MNSFEAKQEARRQRYLDRADKAEADAAAYYKRAKEMAAVIPFGQPILVGHHSEKADRRYRDRIHDTFGRSFREQEKAGHYRARAESVGQGGVSSDDPEACDKLAAQLESRRRTQAVMREANKVVRAFYKHGLRGPDDGEGGQVWSRYLAKLQAIEPHFAESTAAQLLRPDFAGRIGYAGYQLSNNGAQIKRLEARLQQLQRNAEAETKSHQVEGVCELVENVEENRIQLIFPDKPAAGVRAILKGRGFRWAPSQGAWQRHLNNAGRMAARHALADIAAM